MKHDLSPATVIEKAEMVWTNIVSDYGVADLGQAKK
jgi:hypothetical protein